ncbi:uncharacterized protein LOC135925145 [Gordionus sp. m RMFG-2023]|uniref:uncharacterized protein LOC135925145 n=1 Tax=Gordionus sp. m RMFG-2023 TaxID=3053472 RepID=UPI0031FCF2AF
MSQLDKELRLRYPDIKDEDQRSMNITYYRKVNIDGSLNPRNWLSYSTTLDKVFCLYCIMFGGTKSNTFWTQLGVNNWKNIKRDLERHEASSLHKDCEYANMTWLANKRIQDHLLSNKLDIIMENRNIVHNIIDAIMYLIKCNIAFWGSNSNEGIGKDQTTEENFNSEIMTKIKK